MTKQLLDERLDKLEQHLENENPVLVEAVRRFRTLDGVARRLGLLDDDESYATRISWWPLVSILGTFSAGKSSFVNHFLGRPLQRTGNQAVDDLFTVICYAGEQGELEVLPGTALDADPRFPFFGMSEELEAVAPGQGRRIDAYLQMKTCNSERLRGKILIDSPGFDADAQRDAVLKIVDHIVDLSDLVIVMFDARRPEPGAMRDTLDLLVARTANRADPAKFLFVLNQLDTAAREDNPEEIIAAWQRCLAAKGMTAGRFFTIYNPDLAVEIPNPEQRARFEARRDKDLAAIHARIEKVETGRAYRIVGVLENTAEEVIAAGDSRLAAALQLWRTRVIRRAIIQGIVVIAACVGISIQAGWWDGLQLSPPWWEGFASNPWLLWPAVAILVGLAGWMHYRNRRVVAEKIARGLDADAEANALVGHLGNAFRKSTRPLRSLLSKRPSGWSRRARNRALGIVDAATRAVQELNDRFAGPRRPQPETISAEPIAPQMAEQATLEKADVPPLPKSAKDGGAAFRAKF